LGEEGRIRRALSSAPQATGILDAAEFAIGNGFGAGVGPGLVIELLNKFGN
jgi:hypothetical protein